MLKLKFHQKKSLRVTILDKTAKTAIETSKQTNYMQVYEEMLTELIWKLLWGRGDFI